jgi:predicted nucleotidyltransferase
MDVPLLTDDFREFLKSFNDKHVEYLLVGGYAVGLHGYPRATIDLDVWVRPDLANASRVISALRAFGFETTSLTQQLFVSLESLVRFGVPPFRIEIMTAIDGVQFDACHRRAVHFNVDGMSVPVISLADLKINKRAAGRHKDLNDLENLP